MSHPVIQWQILSQDPEKSASFYCELFDWSIDADNPLGYRRVDTGSERGIQGGIWPSPPEGKNFVQLFVEVEDVDAMVDKASSLGAKVVIPAQSLPEGGRMAVLVDPLGIPLALLQVS